MTEEGGVQGVLGVGKRDYRVIGGERLELSGKGGKDWGMIAGKREGG